MKNLPKTDAVIIGGGWTGLLMAKELAARTPISVVVLERGAAPPQRRLRRGHGRAGLQRPLPHDAGLFAADGHAALHHAATAPFPSGNWARSCPGRAPAARASTGVRCFRAIVPDVFELLKSTTEKYGAKKLPEDHSVVDWGITWEEIEPYYTRADKLVGASGKAGNIRGKLIEGGNIFEGPRSEEYPTPPPSCPTTPRSSAKRPSRSAIIRIPIPRRRSAPPTPIPTEFRGPAASTAASATDSAA